jgi:hypothetical protein
MQNAEFVYPVWVALNRFAMAHNRLAYDCGLEDFVAAYAMEWVSPPTQPHVTILDNGSPAFFQAWGASPFFYVVPPADLARIDADPAKRARYVELATHTLIPPMRDLVTILQSTVRCTYA